MILQVLHEGHSPRDSSIDCSSNHLLEIISDTYVAIIAEIVKIVVIYQQRTHVE